MMALAGWNKSCSNARKVMCWPLQPLDQGNVVSIEDGAIHFTLGVVRGRMKWHDYHDVPRVPLAIVAVHRNACAPTIALLVRTRRIPSCPTRVAQPIDTRGGIFATIRPSRAPIDRHLERVICGATRIVASQVLVPHALLKTIRAIARSARQSGMIRIVIAGR